MSESDAIFFAACAAGLIACVRACVLERKVRRIRRDAARDHLRSLNWFGAEIEDAQQERDLANTRAQWRIVRVDTTGRGPNADIFYHVPPNHEGRELWLTDEQVLAAKLRPDTTAKRAYETPL